MEKGEHLWVERKPFEKDLVISHPWPILCLPFFLILYSFIVPFFDMLRNNSHFLFSSCFFVKISFVPFLMFWISLLFCVFHVFYVPSYCNSQRHSSQLITYLSLATLPSSRRISDFNSCPAILQRKITSGREYKKKAWVYE